MFDEDGGDFGIVPVNNMDKKIKINRIEDDDDVRSVKT